MLLGRRVGRAKLGQLLLQALELAHQRVVLTIGDRGRVVAVVALPVLFDLFGEFLVPLPEIVRHASEPIVAG
jgi:hypothetical protein